MTIQSIIEDALSVERDYRRYSAIANSKACDHTWADWLEAGRRGDALSCPRSSHIYPADIEYARGICTGMRDCMARNGFQVQWPGLRA